MFDPAYSRLTAFSFRSLLLNGKAQTAWSTWSKRKLHQSPSFHRSPASSHHSSKPVTFSLVQPHLHYDPDVCEKVRCLPSHIVAPPYATTGRVGPARQQSNLESLSRIDGVRNACRLARKTLNYLGSQLKVQNKAFCTSRNSKRLLCKIQKISRMTSLSHDFLLA